MGGHSVRHATDSYITSRPNLTYALRLAAYALRLPHETFDMTQRGSRNRLAVKRAALWWLLRTTTDASLPGIGAATGAAHPTVLAGVRRHELRMVEDPVEAQRSGVTAEWIDVAWATKQARANERRPLLAADKDGR